MPRTRPATTGYERLAQAEQFSDDEDGLENSLDSSFPSLQHLGPQNVSSTKPRPHVGMASPSMPSTSAATDRHHYGTAPARRTYAPLYATRHARSNSGVDLKAINARLERWADEIAAKFKRGGRARSGTNEEDRPEIHYSVFQAPEGVRPITKEALAMDAEAAPSDGTMTKDQFESIISSVRLAIDEGVHPRMISQGSSGSYFARNPAGKVVGVFKPKDEEPYAAGNPKWNKWIHRNLFPCCFGRACLIPNLSYVSEAAAYILDSQLRTHLVPYTDVVYLSSKSFHYPFWDRYSHSRNRKPLPAKPGSFQVFLKGFKDANVFLRENPWPDQYLSGIRTGDRRGGRSRKERWTDNCRPGSWPHRNENNNAGSSGPSEGGEASSNNGRGSGPAGRPANGAAPQEQTFMWTEPLKQAFREELEKLVILDYIMRNTDRGLDNWMVKVDWPNQDVTIVSEPMHLHMDGHPDQAQNGESSSPVSDEHAPRLVDLSQRPQRETRAAYPPYRAPKPMNASSNQEAGNATQPSISLGAIDNSLSWPWKHPDAWRSFPFGWLFLPVDLIGRPFSQKTRDHFLPLLTSPAWWSQTQAALRRVFQMDPDFQERMFARQIAVMKGQAWNVVETLKAPDHGPLELTRRAKVCVWDDLVEVPIAFPMRAASLEMRRRAETAIAAAMEDEMDIGASGVENNGGAAGRQNGGSAEDLLIGSSSPRAASPPSARLPPPRRFMTSRNSLLEEDEENGAPYTDAVRAGASPPLPTSPSPPLISISPNGSSQLDVSKPSAAQAASSEAQRQRLPAARNTHESLNMYAPERQRRYSHTTAASRRHSSSIAQQLYSGPSHGSNFSGSSTVPRFRASSVDAYVYDEDVDGDLGYAAAEGMENSRRKVIVERLEPVKSKNPVFTWC